MKTQAIDYEVMPTNLVTKPEGAPPEIVFSVKLSNNQTYEVPDDFFNYVYIPYLDCNDRYQLYFGGFGSGKSKFLIQRAILNVAFGERNYVCIRRYKNTIENSIFKEILQEAEALGLRGLFHDTKNPFRIICKSNQRSFDFFGLDEPTEIKSYIPLRGVLTDILIDEATDIPNEHIFDWIDSRLRGIDRTLPLDQQKPMRLTMAFNPEGGTEHWLYKKFFQGKFTINDWEKRYKLSFDRDELLNQKRQELPGLSLEELNRLIDIEAKHYNVSMLRTTHLHNRFLTTQQRISYSNYQGDQKIVGQMGWWATSSDIVFKQGVHWFVEDLSNHEALNPKHGLDFGYDPDPFAYVKLDYDKKRKIIYVLKAIDDTKEQNPAIAEAVYPYAKREPVNCDSAEKKSIEELRSRSVCGEFALNAKAVRKTSGYINKRRLNYIEFKIQWLKQHKIIVDKRLKGVMAEFDNYARKRDRNGNLTNTYTGADHYIDAISYALNDEMFKTQRTLVTVSKAAYKKFY